MTNMSIVHVGVNINTSKEEEEEEKKENPRDEKTSTTTSHVIMVHIMLYINSILVFVCFLSSSIDACNIWKASDCPAPPTADDEEIV